MRSKHSIIFLCLLSLSLLGCGKNELSENQTADASPNEIAATFPLTWYPPVNNLPVIEPTPPVAISRSDLQQLLKIKWHRTVHLNDTITEKTVAIVESCEDYLSNKVKGLEPIYRNWYFYMRTVLLCEAIEVVINGKDSTSSNIGKITLDKAFADMLPIELAFFVSPSYEKEVLSKSKGKSWSWHDKIEGVTNIDGYSAEYKIEDATQIISILARGDFNDDKVEDILLLVENAIDGVRTYPTRLFVITRKQGESMFRFVKEYELRSKRQ